MMLSARGYSNISLSYIVYILSSVVYIKHIQFVQRPQARVYSYTVQGPVLAFDGLLTGP